MSWVLVHDTVKVFVAQENTPDQVTESLHTIETFETEALMRAQIQSLNLEVPNDPTLSNSPSLGWPTNSP